MSSDEALYSVWLGDRRAGTIHHSGDYTRFALDDEYRANPGRPVLGLIFEQDLYAQHKAALRLPPWFSNLLPEGHLRNWIAEDRGVSVDREMELLAQVGHDLPGAVRVLPHDEPPSSPAWDPERHGAPSLELEGEHPGWRFSLAGVGLKFSMLAKDDRLTLPAYGEGGDWIVKLPDRLYADVPRNEYAMMSLAGAAGIDVPELKLKHRDDLEDLPPQVWPEDEEWAYAVRRFDRDEQRGLIHIEDLAQVCNVYADRKYLGNYETVASLIYRRHDVEALREFARRLAFLVLISSGDAHLKNWSLIYRDPRMPTLSPAYDLVATAYYRQHTTHEEDDLALKFGGSKRLRRVSLDTFTRLERKLGAQGADLADCAAEVVRLVRENWPRFAEYVNPNRALRESISESIESVGRTLLRRSPT